MKITIRRLTHDENSTISTMSINDVFTNFTLEDTKREVKVKGKTRIPAGIYKVELRNSGGMNKNYAEKFGFHRGMLHLQNVPNFTYIYIHYGNYHANTDGCLLTGNTCDVREGKKMVGHSVDAYKEIYLTIANTIESGEDVYIEVLDELVTV